MSLQKSREIFNKLQNLNGLEVTRALTGQQKWNDIIFKENYLAKKKLNEHFKLNETVLYCKEFLNWYVSGNGGNKINEKWLAIVASMQVPTSTDENAAAETLLAEIIFTGKVHENDVVIKLMPPSASVKRLSSNEFKNFNNEICKIEGAEINAWYDFLYDILESFGAEHKEEAVAEETKQNGAQEEHAPPAAAAVTFNNAPSNILNVINYLGYIALNMLISIKNSFKFDWHFVNNVTNDFRSFWRTKNIIQMRTPPPHKMAVEKFKESEIIIDSLIPILATYAFNESAHKQLVRRILQKACLDHLALWGLGCLFWLLKAQKFCETRAEVILNLIGRESVTTLELRDVLENYVRKPQSELTWRWSRIICSKAFYALATVQDPALAATFAALAYKCDMEKPIWNNCYFKKEDVKQQAEKKAKIIMQKIKKRQEQKATATENK